MENENVNAQQPSYEQLMQAYMQLVQESHQMKMSLSSLQFDKMNERIGTLVTILNSDLSAEIKELAEYHLKEMLKKPEDIKTKE